MKAILFQCILKNIYKSNSVKNYLINNAEVSRKTGRNESRILEETVPSRNSDIRVKRRELPSQEIAPFLSQRKAVSVPLAQ